MRMYQYIVPASLFIFATALGLVTLGVVDDILKICGVLVTIGILAALRPSRSPTIHRPR